MHNRRVTDAAAEPLHFQPWTALNDETICYSKCQTPLECGISSEFILGAGIVMWMWAGRSRVRNPAGEEILLSSTMSRLALGSNKPHSQRVLALFPWGGKAACT